MKSVLTDGSLVAESLHFGGNATVAVSGGIDVDIQEGSASISGSTEEHKGMIPSMKLKGKNVPNSSLGESGPAPTDNPWTRRNEEASKEPEKSSARKTEPGSMFVSTMSAMVNVDKAVDAIMPVK